MAWTRVFTRDEIAELQISVHTLGPDLLYDRSLREAAQQGEDGPGEVVFSPMLFRKEDLSRELSDCKIPLPSLIGLGEVATKAKQRFAPLSPGGPAAGSVDGRGAEVALAQAQPRLKRSYERRARAPWRL